MKVRSGSQDDLAKATEIARAIALHSGLVEGLWPVAYDTEPGRILDNNAATAAEGWTKDTEARLSGISSQPKRAPRMNRACLECAPRPGREDPQ